MSVSALAVAAQVVSDADALVLQEGRAALEAGRYEEAVQVLEAIAGKRSEIGEAYFLMARAYDALDDEPNATRAINRAIDLAPVSTLYREWQHRIGSRAFRPIQKMRERAMLRGILDIDPDNAYALTAVGAEQTLIYQHHRHRYRFPELTPFESPLLTSREISNRTSVSNSDAPLDPGLPRLNDPFDAETLRESGYVVQYLGMRADSAYAAAATHLERALNAHPGYREAYRPIMALYAAGENHFAMRYWATQLRDRYPDDPDAWMYLGYALHRLGESMEAEQAFERGRALLDSSERQVYEDVDRIMNDAQRDRVAGQDGFSAETFWAGKDPRYLTPANEREIEHYARVLYADLQFSEPKLDRRGWDSDRGEVYIRYGPPSAMYYLSNSMTNCGGRTTSGNLNSITNFHVFEYPSSRFVFGNPGNFGDASNVALPPFNEFPLYSPCSDAFAPTRNQAAQLDYVIYTRNTIRETPETYTYATAARTVDFPSLASVFKDADGSASMYVAYGIPLAVGPRERALNLGLDAGAFLVSETDGLLASHRHQVGEVPGMAVHAFSAASLWIGVHPMKVPAGDHMLSVEFESSANAALGDMRYEVSVPDYSRPGFALSDIQLAYLVEPASSAGAADPAHYVRNGTTIHPAPWGVFGVDQPLYIYFEMYNLEQEAGGQTRYEVEALLVEQGRESGLQRLFRRAFRRGGGGEGVAVRFDGVGNSADEGQYFIMDASQQPPGTYVLALRVTDLVREQTVESRRTVMLE